MSFHYSRSYCDFLLSLSFFFRSFSCPLFTTISIFPAVHSQETVKTKQLRSIGPEYTTVMNKPAESKYCSFAKVLQCFAPMVFICSDANASPSSSKNKTI